MTGEVPGGVGPGGVELDHYTPESVAARAHEARWRYRNSTRLFGRGLVWAGSFLLAGAILVNIYVLATGGYDRDRPDGTRMNRGSRASRIWTAVDCAA